MGRTDLVSGDAVLRVARADLERTGDGLRDAQRKGEVMMRAVKVFAFCALLIFVAFETAFVAAPVFVQFGWSAGVICVAVLIGALTALFDAILA